MADSPDRMVKRILLIGDLHAGSIHAPWPLDWIDGKSPHVGARYVTECLAAFIEACPRVEHDGEEIDPWRYRVRRFLFDLPRREVIS